MERYPLLFLFNEKAMLTIFGLTMSIIHIKGKTVNVYSKDNRLIFKIIILYLFFFVYIYFVIVTSAVYTSQPNDFKT